MQDRPLYSKSEISSLTEACKLWLDEISRILAGFRPIQHRNRSSSQHSVMTCAGDLMSTCVDDGANKQLIRALEARYRQFVEREGKIYLYLRLTFDFSADIEVVATPECYDVTELPAGDDARSAMKMCAAEDPYVMDKSSAKPSRMTEDALYTTTTKTPYLSERACKVGHPSENRTKRS